MFLFFASSSIFITVALADNRTDRRLEARTNALLRPFLLQRRQACKRGQLDSETYSLTLNFDTSESGVFLERLEIACGDFKTIVFKVRKISFDNPKIKWRVSKTPSPARTLVCVFSSGNPAE